MRQRYDLKPGDKMENLHVNAAFGGMFVSITLQTAGHLGQDHSESLLSIKNQHKQSLKQLFHATEKLITDQKEITSIPVIDWQQFVWQRATLFTDKAVQFATEKTDVFSDSALCVGGPVYIPSKHGRRRLIGL